MVKTRRRFRNRYSILLACLASTDVLVGAVTLPGLIAGEIYAITGGSVDTYCKLILGQIYSEVFRPLVLTLIHLVLISFERFIAMKYPFRYQEIVTKPRLTIAVVFSWFLVVLYLLCKLLSHSLLPRAVAPTLVLLARQYIIAYCHFAVYLVTRRHEKQIATEQISKEAAEKFLKEKKAWKTTIIMIGFVILSFLPVVALDFWRLTGFALKARLVFQPFITYIVMINSLVKPILYCWRCKDIRKAMIALLGKG